MSKPMRQSLVKETRKRLEGQKNAILVDYRGISARQIAELRDILRKDKIRMTVLKNSTAAIAFKEVGFGALESSLVGQNALVFGIDDPSQMAKAVYGWKDKNPKLLEIKGAIVEGKPVAAKDLKSIADLPPRLALMGMLAGVLQAPTQALATAMNGVSSNLARALQAKADKKEEPTAAS